MNVLYFSDIHIEIRERNSLAPWIDLLPLGYGPDLTSFTGDTDLVVLAGDIGRVRSQRNVSPLTYAQQVAEYLNCEVAMVPGNHEYYRGSFDEVRTTLMAARIPGVAVLDRREMFYPHRHGTLRVLGATLWTDYALLQDPEQGMHDARQVLPDHRLIHRNADAAFLPQDALAEHTASRDWLGQRLAETHDGQTLIVTHHVPHSLAQNPQIGTTPLSPAFCSDCDDLIEAAAQHDAAAWIFGHHHWSHEVDVRGVRLLSAQPGYPGEQTAWSGPGRITI